MSKVKITFQVDDGDIYSKEVEVGKSMKKGIAKMQNEYNILAFQVLQLLHGNNDFNKPVKIIYE